MATPLHEKTFPSDENKRLPRPFILRRLHSLLGVWLVVYLFEHLLVNSQSALYFQDEGSSFISMVNKIHDLPFLKAIEIIFLGLPFLIHGIWGVLYLRTGKLNAHSTDGTKPALPQYKRNRAYSWQRITSWILLVGIIAHVVHMRFVEYPILTYQGEAKRYSFRLEQDPGLNLVAAQLHILLFNQHVIKEKQDAVERSLIELEDQSESVYFAHLNTVREDREWLEAISKKKLKEGEVLAVAPSAGAAFFLILRQTFKSPLMVILYSILVVAAAYHAFNGLWTFMISWGATLTRRSQKRMRTLVSLLMSLVIFLGLMAAWGTYWTVMFQQ